MKFNSVESKEADVLSEEHTLKQEPVIESAPWITEGKNISLLA